jgi:hypothetical protein
MQFGFVVQKIVGSQSDWSLELVIQFEFGHLGCVWSTQVECGRWDGVRLSIITLVGVCSLGCSLDAEIGWSLIAQIYSGHSGCKLMRHQGLLLVSCIAVCSPVWCV